VGSEGKEKNLLLLLGETGLDLLEVEQLRAELEGEGQLLVEVLVVLFEFLLVGSLELAEGLGVLALGLEEIFVPLLVKFVVLLDVGVLTLFPLLGLVEDQLVDFPLVVLVLELGNPVLGHLGFDVLAVDFAGVSVLFENLARGELERERLLT